MLLSYTHESKYRRSYIVNLCTLGLRVRMYHIESLAQAAAYGLQTLLALLGSAILVLLICNQIHTAAFASTYAPDMLFVGRDVRLMRWMPPPQTSCQTECPMRPPMLKPRPVQCKYGV
jgi:hypothetical protein